ncbi:flagellar assembly protein FliH [Denitratisoma oestradiolicum]|uniref:Flagellar assembly protein FliH n=1 Tax=Denitratisoma oestradiolicum TaxID=311182 RepID=A0A6S6XWW5_9PROT|nr:flagellar assembly protein FliH [Denitratisoma oestradiolicum]TWO81582.1 hypothetical protein CBW56_02385 [Denitratisoma oestradiolicum]CAB1370519.1 conserved protein of unknown function [Denitratisoma oestradiolicum]
MTVKKSLTAWERWELASFDGHTSPTPAKAKAVAAPPVPPVQSAEEIARLRQEAYQVGHSEGFAAGNAAGLEAGRKTGESEGRRAAQQLMGIATKLDQALEALDEAVADELTALALEVAREVLCQSIAAAPETVVTVVREALGHLPHQHANIYLHPEDASLVRTYAGDQLSHAGHRIHEDAKLKRGDVVLEAAGAHVDGTLATRWRRVIETLGLNIPWIGDHP